MSARVRLFDVEIDPLRMPQAVERVLDWARRPVPPAHRYVVTPNLDHVVMLQRDPQFRAAYRDAALVVADGMPVVAASRLLGKPLPERITGADLVPALFSAAEADRPLSVFLLGAGPGVAQRAAENIERRWPAVNVVGTCSPPFGFENDATENASILQRVRAARPDVLVVGLGAPKQELWVHHHRNEIAANVSLCVGATIDFLAGHIRRAPRWMQRAGLEWLYRLACEPRRLFGRYARDAWSFPRLLWRESRQNKTVA